VIQISAELGDGHTAITVTGHEGHREDGRVCAAVSAITATALLGLAEIARAHPDLVTVTIQERT
jgi:uncharacterized protein